MSKANFAVILGKWDVGMFVSISLVQSVIYDFGVFKLLW